MGPKRRPLPSQPRVIRNQCADSQTDGYSTDDGDSLTTDQVIPGTPTTTQENDTAEPVDAFYANSDEDGEESLVDSQETIPLPDFYWGDSPVDVSNLMC